MIKVGITGGIGSGKSTVCRLFAEEDVPVYDSDLEAKRLMTENAALREELAKRFGTAIYTDEGLNRKALAACVFGDPAELAALNALVHPAVMRDFERWCEQYTDADYVLFESAILFDVGLESAVDRTLAVVAPPDARVERTCLRDGITEEDVRRRIAVQLADEELIERADYTLINIDRARLRTEVARLDKLFRDESRKNNA